jgi:hypothetical protein
VNAFETLSTLCTSAPLKTSTVVVNVIDLLEVLHELETFRTSGATKPASKYTAEFEEAWTIYPARPGASKAATFKAWTARLKAGATALEMIEGTQAYADYCKAERTEAAYIKQPATFYGPGEHYAADWTPRRPPGAAAAVAGAGGRGPRPPLADINQANNDEALRLLAQPNFDDMRTIDESV